METIFIYFFFPKRDNFFAFPSYGYAMYVHLVNRTNAKIRPRLRCKNRNNVGVKEMDWDDVDGIIWFETVSSLRIL